MSVNSTQANKERSPLRFFLLCLLTIAGMIALSPILFDLGLHLIQVPVDRYAALFPALFLIAVWKSPRTKGQKDGYIFLTIAVFIAIVSIGGGFTRWGRLAIPLVAIGLIRISGATSLRKALLSFWLIPTPHFLETTFWPNLVLLYGKGAANFLPELSLQETGMTLMARGTRELSLNLHPADSGWALAAALSGVAYFIGNQKNRTLMRTIASVAFYTIAALPLQALAILAALLLMDTERVVVAREWLNYFPLLAALVCLGFSYRSFSTQRES